MIPPLILGERVLNSIGTNAKNLLSSAIKSYQRHLDLSILNEFSFSFQRLSFLGSQRPLANRRALRGLVRCPASGPEPSHTLMKAPIVAILSGHQLLETLFHWIILG
jgi:hypothetical protein